MKKSEKGISLLETALVIPSILLFVLGTVDAATYVRNFNAAKQAVEAGLRCVYPTDPKCTSIRPDTVVAQNDLYVPPIFSHQFNYDGREKKLILPNYAYGAVSATVLDQIHYTANSDHRYSAVKYGFPSTGTVQALSMDFPRISGSYSGGDENSQQSSLLSFLENSSINGGGSLNSTLLTDESVSYDCKSLPYWISNGVQPAFNLEGYNGKLADNPKKVGEYSFTLPEKDVQYEGIDICQMESNGKLVNQNSDRKECSIKNWNGKDLSFTDQARIVFKYNGSAELDSGKGNYGFHIYMQGYYTLPGSNRRYGIKISAPGSNQGSYDLGGQEKRVGRQDSNFIPRGFSTSEILYASDNREGVKFEGSNSSIDKDWFSKTIDYHSKLMVPWGSTVHILLYAGHPTGAGKSCPSGAKVTWNNESFIAKYGVLKLHSEEKQCAGPSRDRLSCKELQNHPDLCRVSDKNSDPIFDRFLNLKPRMAKCSSEFNSIISETDSGCFDHEPEVLDILYPNGVSNDQNPNYELKNYGSLNCTKPVVLDCPNDNKGTTTAAGSDGLVRNSSEAESACPPRLTDNPISDSMYWSEKVAQNIIPSGQIKRDSQDCTFDPSKPISESELSSPANEYKKLILPTAYKTGSTQFDTSKVDPDKLKKLPRFACANVSTEIRNFDEGSKDSFTDKEWSALIASDFYGSHNQLGCNAEEILKEEAHLIGMSEKSFFEISNQQALRDLKYITISNNVDSCMTVEIDKSLASSNLRTKVAGGPFDEGQISAQCIINGKNECISIPNGFRRIEGSGESKMDFSAAQLVAKNTALTFTGGHCPDCIKAEVSQPGVINGLPFDPSKPIKMSVSVNQPFTLLANNSVSINYSSERKWEGLIATKE